MPSVWKTYHSHFQFDFCVNTPPLLLYPSLLDHLVIRLTIVSIVTAVSAVIGWLKHESLTRYHVFRMVFCLILWQRRSQSCIKHTKCMYHDESSALPFIIDDICRQILSNCLRSAWFQVTNHVKVKFQAFRKLVNVRSWKAKLANLSQGLLISDLERHAQFIYSCTLGHCMTMWPGLKLFLWYSLLFYRNIFIWFHGKCPGKDIVVLSYQISTWPCFSSHLRLLTD